MVHFAGLNDKHGWANQILTEIQTQRWEIQSRANIMTDPRCVDSLPSIV
jgi:hypothetical protein